MYHDEYWEPWCDRLPTGIDYLYFDMCVNAGPHRATCLLQEALGVTADGQVGPVTRNAMIGAANRSQALIEDYTALKRDFYRSLHQPHFIKGWLNRCDAVEKNALSMIGA